MYRRKKLGLNGHSIEIDESVFSRNRETGKKVWVLGFYERGTKNCRAIHVPDRIQETLTRVILEQV